MDELVNTTQIREILTADSKKCPSCKSAEIDVRYMNGYTGETGWDCVCGHKWETTKESRKLLT